MIARGTRMQTGRFGQIDLLAHSERAARSVPASAPRKPPRKSAAPSPGNRVDHLDRIDEPREGVEYLAEVPASEGLQESLQGRQVLERCPMVATVRAGEEIEWGRATTEILSMLQTRAPRVKTKYTHTYISGTRGALVVQRAG